MQGTSGRPHPRTPTRPTLWSSLVSYLLSQSRAAFMDSQVGRSQYLHDMDRLSPVSMTYESSVMFRVGGVME